MISFPTGTVTFLFTDIEGSTYLWEEYPDAMRPALVRHDGLLRQAIESRGGFVFKTVGDAFCAAFAAAPAALAAALEIQRGLVSERWPLPTPLRVRIALHTGAAVEREGDYFGPTLNRVARLLAAGHGQQVLLSAAAEARIGPCLPEGASLRDLGSHRLKDLSQPEHISQLCHPALPQDFPPLRSLQAFPNNLPLQTTSFVGREREMADVKVCLGGARLLTLTGAGGFGKTRLALQVAADLVEDYGDGVWLAELAPLSDPALVPQAVAHALGVREEPGRTLTQTLAEYLRPKTVLLILDNCEHLVAASAALADALIRSCPAVRVLATSRERLGVPGEKVHRVPPLAVPDPARLPPSEAPAGGDGKDLAEDWVKALAEYEAVRLFQERAAAAAPAFAVTARNAAAVVQVCRRLDGIPLALELAAVRVRALPVEQVAARLDDRFRLLTGGSRTALPRQQTLRALIDWSYDLLAEPEKALLRRLSVFAGGWTMEAAEAVCAGADMPEWEVLDLLTGLVDKSLVVYEEPEDGRARYRLLETVRRYAADRLQEAGEDAALRMRHGDFCLALAEEAAPHLTGPEQAAWLDRLEAEHDNLRAAVAALSAPDRPADRAAGRLLRLTASLGWFWHVRGYLSEGRASLEGALSQAGADDRRSPAGAKAVQSAGTLAYQQGAFDTARAFWQESLAANRALGDRRAVGSLLNNLGVLTREQGDYVQAHVFLEEALALRRDLGQKPDIAGTLNNLALVVGDRGDADAAQAYYTEALALLRDGGSPYNMAYTLNNLGKLAVERGDYGLARVYLEEALALRRQIGDKRGIALTLVSLGNLAHEQKQAAGAKSLYEQALVLTRENGDTWLLAFALAGLASLNADAGDYAAALTFYAESLKCQVTVGDKTHIAHTLRALAQMRHAQGRHAAASRLWAATAAILEATGAALPQSPARNAENDRAIAAARAALGERAFVSAWKKGRAMTQAEAVADALAD